jgi:hypothetical protein
LIHTRTTPDTLPFRRKMMKTLLTVRQFELRLPDSATARV